MPHRIAALLAIVIASAGATAAAATPAYRNALGERVALPLAPQSTAERMIFRVPDTELTFALEREVIVELRSPAGSPPVAILSAIGLEPIERLGEHGATWLARARSPAAVLAATERAQMHPDIAWAVPDFIARVELYHAPADPYYEYQWYCGRDDSDAHLHAEAAWDITLGDPAVKVAVIDTGVELGHPEFDGSRIAAPYNSITQSSDPVPGDTAFDAHGTACSGTIAAAIDNAEGMAGLCPRCSLMPVRAIDPGGISISSARRAIDHATDNDAWVISASWGYREEQAQHLDLTPIHDAVRRALSDAREGQGALTLFASGNDGRAIGDHELPMLAEAIAVGATGRTDEWLFYSNFGAALDLVAPSESFSQTDWIAIFTADLPGDRGMSRDGFYYLVDPQGDRKSDREEPDAAGDYTAYFNGTSASCPIAAGVLGLIFSANTDLTASEARRIIEGTADKVGGVSYDEKGWHEQYGYGRINAARAVTVARLGLDNPEGAACSESLNCTHRHCFGPDAGGEIFCAALCSVDSDCEVGQSCAEIPGQPSVCLPGCVAHDDCEGATVCNDRACQTLSCSEDGECPAGAVCAADGICEAEQVEDPADPLGRVTGGCGCGARQGGPLSWLASLLVLALVRRRR